MKKVFFAKRQVFSLFLLIAGLSVFSCKSTPESTLIPEQPLVENPLQETEIPEPDVPEAKIPELEIPEEEPDEGPIAALPPEVPEEEDGEIPEPEEPSFDFAEVVVEPTPPPEQPLDSVLPEPVAPEIAEAPSPEVQPPEPPLPETPPPSPEPAPPPVAAAPPPAPVQEAPPVVRPVPQNPPSFIRPAEEERPPVVREPVPLPAAPIPEAPARSPPVEIQEPGISFSRVVRATVGQMIEVPFQGSGWVYLGELGSRPGIAYSSRRLDPEGQSFVFRAEAPGTYGLKFYKQDFVRDYILNDYVQVIVGEPPEAAAMGWFNPSIDRGRVVAEPRWPTALAEAEAFSRGTSGGTAATSPAPAASAGQAAAPPAAAPPAAGQAAPAAQAAAQPPAAVPARPALSDEGVIPVRPAASVQPTPGAVQPEALGNLQPSGYLERARQEFDAGRVATAISVLDQFRERYPSGTDEAWWLYGQFYEANSPSRDIRTSLDYYRRLVREYPQSSRYNDARRRIAYLERYYINIQ